MFIPVTAKDTIKYFGNAEALEAAAANAIVHAEVVLDIGCGIRPMTLFEPKVHLCFEAFEPYVAILQKRFASVPNVVLLKVDALEGLTLLPNRSIDSIFLLDVLEHMPKEYGIEVLRQCDRVARRQIVISTPLGFMRQSYEEGEKDGWGVAYNKLQEHLSGWEPQDFGDGWHFLICSTYHKKDAEGEQLEKPFGSFYAIRNIESLRKTSSVKPILIGATVPPAPINGKVREEILAIFEGMDQSQIQILSSYDARPYSPYYNIPHLLEFSTRRLDGQYHHIRFPEGWVEMLDNPPPYHQIAPQSARFLAPLIETCRTGGHNPVVLCDLTGAELLLAYYLAVEAGTRTLFLSSPSYPLDAIPNLFRQLPHARLDLTEGIEQVRSVIFHEDPLHRAYTLLKKVDRITRKGHVLHSLLRRIRNFLGRISTAE